MDPTLPHRTVASLTARYGARPIRGCPGRAVLRVESSVRLRDLLDPTLPIHSYDELPSARDAVHVARLADGGVVSFRRPDGSWVHTVNTPEGFRRRLARFGLAEPSSALDAKHARECDVAGIGERAIPGRR